MTQSQARVIAAIGLLTDVAKSDIFDRPAKPFSAGPAIRDKVLQSYLATQTRNHWVLLESIVVFDEVLYDGYAFKRHKMNNDMRNRIDTLHKHGLLRSLWPVEIYERTASKLADSFKFLNEMGLREVAREVAADEAKPYSVLNDAFYDGAEKNYHDDLFDSSIAQFSFADSDLSFERAFFYAELTNELGINLLSRPSSFGPLLDKVSRSYSQCAHQLMQQSLKEFDAIMRPAEFSVRFPPLAEKIAWLSLDQGRAPIDVAAELRESTNAKAYRRHIADLQGELREKIPSPDRLKRLMADFDSTVQKWVSDKAPDENVKFRTRNLRIQILPAIASFVTYLATWDARLAASVAGGSNVVLQAIFGNTLVITDPILWGGDKYLSFVSDWYKS